MSPTIALLEKLAKALRIDVRDFLPPRRRQPSMGGRAWTTYRPKQRSGVAGGSQTPGGYGSVAATAALCGRSVTRAAPAAGRRTRKPWWQDVDFLTGFITISRSKHGQSRRVPMNVTVRSVLLDLGAARQRPDDPTEYVFAVRPRESKVFFPKAAQRAKAALTAAGVDAPHLDAYCWHSNRHTFASRLAMQGVDLLTIKELGGWRTLAMVQRYAHSAPGHLHAAVDRLVLGHALQVTPK